MCESEILGQDHEAVCLRILKDCFVRLSAQANVANVFGFKAFRAKQRCQ